ncbi:MAG: hypothetical protein IKN63_01845 [Bacilli bacterium]|nr:hypothetical protein [Bacilli bacterium]
MGKINSEIIISSLLAIGFDQVDSLLFTYTLEKMTTANTQLKLFEFKDEKTSQIFNKYIEYDGSKFKFREGYDLNTIVLYRNIELPLYKVLNINGILNNVLIEYLKTLDFKEIIIKKIMALGTDRIDDYEELFCDKEKEIIYEMFKIGKMQEKKSKIQLQIYKNMARQEEEDNERLLNYLNNRINKNKVKVKEKKYE